MGARRHGADRFDAAFLTDFLLRQNNSYVTIWDIRFRMPFSRSPVYWSRPQPPTAVGVAAIAKVTGNAIVTAAAVLRFVPIDSGHQAGHIGFSISFTLSDPRPPVNRAPIP
jgi:hypothetical protein